MSKKVRIQHCIIGLLSLLLCFVFFSTFSVKKESKLSKKQYSAGELVYSKVENIPITIVEDGNVSAGAITTLQEDGWSPIHMYSDNAPIDLDAPVTEENVLALLDAYCPDGAYILRQTMDGISFLCWWSDNSRIISSLDTAVHEQCHAYTHSKALDFNSEAIYIGDSQSIQVNYTDVFRSNEMALTIPEELRTFRYDPYIGNPSEYLSSDVQGIYGLLNEFTAYYWGMNAGVSLFPYYKNFESDIEMWRQYICDGENGRTAYAEFQFFIFNYLKYAKENYPSIYDGIINNKYFIAAYQQIERKYQQQIKQYEDSLSELVGILQKQGHDVKYNDGMLYVDNYGFGVKTDDYSLLLEELKDSKYDEIKHVLDVEISLESVLKINPEDNNSNTLSSKKVRKIVLSGLSKQIAAGKKITLKADIRPFNAKNKRIRWYSSNSRIASVNQKGVVTIHKKMGGKTVVITAKAVDGSGVKASYKIKVMKGVVKKVAITGSKKRTAKAGQKLKLKSKVTATRGANRKLLWKSSNTDYATVSSFGNVKLKRKGKGKTVKITAMATDGSNKKYTVKIKIK